MSGRRWAVLVVEKDGSQEYLRSGRDFDGPIIIGSRRDAEEHADFLRIGIGDDVQSINVVPAPLPQQEPNARPSAKPGIAEAPGSAGGRTPASGPPSEDVPEGKA